MGLPSMQPRWIVLALAVPLIVLAPPDSAPRLRPAALDDLITLNTQLEARPAGLVDLSGWLRADLPPGQLSLRLTCAGRAPIQLSVKRGAELPPGMEVPADVNVHQFFRGPEVDTRRLPPGAWLLTAVLDTQDRSGAPLESSQVLGSFLAGGRPVPGSDIPAWLLALAVLMAPVRGRWRWLFLGAVLAQAWLVAQTFLTAAALG
jgi:hypothetical protein